MEELLDIDFLFRKVNGLKILIKVKPLKYSDYIYNIVKNSFKETLEVKLNDLKNNIVLIRIKNSTIKDYERAEKRYIPSYEKY